MAYWVNRLRYPVPLDAGCDDPDTSDVSAVSIDPSEDTYSPITSESAFSGTPKTSSGSNAREMLQGITDHLNATRGDGGVIEERESSSTRHGDWASARLTRALLPEVSDYFFHRAERERTDEAVRKRLENGERFVVVAHGFGAVIAYHVLAQLQRDGARARIPLLVTTGSPLGMREIQDGLRDLLDVDGLPALKNVDHWVNVTDRNDPVAAGDGLRGLYGCRGEVQDARVKNQDQPRHPHSATGYLTSDCVKKAVDELVGAEFSQATTRFTIARDVSDLIEDSADDEPHEVLIELRAPDHNLKAAGQQLEEKIRAIATARTNGQRLDFTHLERFLAVELTSSEIERLGHLLRQYRFGRIWRDSEKTAMLERSADTVQARPAWRVYSALGEGIQWAVLDTGICFNHPHFTDTGTVVGVWDCTGSGAEPVANEVFNSGDKRSLSSLAASVGFDRSGHGTHVSGIIAGRWPRSSADPDQETIAGMAPLAKIHSFKVLADNGRGRDSYIIKALQKIEQINRQAGQLVIHGVNLSLGGPFDPEVFGCGHSPICSELRRLWNQGVIVVTSAGNAGTLSLNANGKPLTINLDLSVGDPANLEECIAVGSVHRTAPGLYGVSHFSSRGPTADGRFKPDVVAPGERIRSAKADFQIPSGAALTDASDNRDYYIEMSGTSMAAPHVSGILAAFLSAREGYIGRPSEVKRILMENCADLGRDRYHQGAGLPNLAKMLLAVNS